MHSHYHCVPRPPGPLLWAKLRNGSMKNEAEPRIRYISYPSILYCNRRPRSDGQRICGPLVIKLLLQLSIIHSLNQLQSTCLFKLFGLQKPNFCRTPPPPTHTRDPPKNVTSEILLYSTSKAIEIHLLVTQWTTCGKSKNGKMPPCEHNRIFKGRGMRAAVVR